MAEPYYSDDAITIYHGDCLDVLDELTSQPFEHAQAFVTDPPYSSGTRKEMGKSSSGAMLRGQRFADRPIDLDQMTTQGFVWLIRAIAQIGNRMIEDSGSLLSFIDWRQWSNLTGALETCNYRVQGMVVWDKGSIGMGNGFRRQHELICHASRGVPNVYNRGIGDVIQAGRVEPIDHPSPKPITLMHQLIEVTVDVDRLLVNPFMGSGTTLRAAKDIGRRAIGIELDEAHCETAAKRCAQEVLAL